MAKAPPVRVQALVRDLEAVELVGQLSQDDQAKILGGNARRLMKLREPALV